MPANSMPRRSRLRITLIAFAFPVASAVAQSGDVAEEGGRPHVRGIYNWVHTTADAEAAFAFYRDLLGIGLAPFPFGSDPDAEPEPIRPVAEARSDRLVWNLTNTEGSRFRTVFMRAPNTAFGLELAEFFDIERREPAVDAFDPGAAITIFEVGDLDAVVRDAGRLGAAIVTVDRTPVETNAGRSIVIRDTDGHLLRLVQTSAAAIEAAETRDAIVFGTSIAITVADTDRALAYYRDLLGFEVVGTRRASEAEVRLHGSASGTLTVTKTRIPGAVIELLEFDDSGAVPEPITWRIQDVGAPQFQLEVTGLDALLAGTTQSGYRFLSIGGEPIDRPFGRFVFAIDPDGVLVEYVEPAR